MYPETVVDKVENLVDSLVSARGAVREYKDRLEYLGKIYDELLFLKQDIFVYLNLVDKTKISSLDMRKARVTSRVLDSYVISVSSEISKLTDLLNTQKETACYLEKRAIEFVKLLNGAISSSTDTDLGKDVKSINPTPPMFSKDDVLNGHMVKLFNSLESRDRDVFNGMVDGLV